MTGERNRAVRLVQKDGKPTPVPSTARERAWPFPPPIGRVDVTLLPFSEVMTLSRHLRIDTIESWLATVALRDVRDAATPPATDSLGRSAQQFAMDAIVVQGDTTHRATASGQDIYAVSAPIIVEAAVRLIAGDTGCRAACAVSASCSTHAISSRRSIRWQYRSARQPIRFSTRRRKHEQQ